MRLRKKDGQPGSWRVQAHWTVDGQRQSYRPTFYESRRRAERAAREMAKTLSHFPTLEVLVVPATAEEAEAADRDEAAAIDASRREPMHLMLDPIAGVTACGQSGNSSSLDFWDVGDSLKCPVCDAMASEQAGQMQPGHP